LKATILEYLQELKDRKVEEETAAADKAKETKRRRKY